MNNLLSKAFFAAAVARIAYCYAYHSDSIVLFSEASGIALLGILAHFAFERREVAK